MIFLEGVEDVIIMKVLKFILLLGLLVGCSKDVNITEDPIVEEVVDEKDSVETVDVRGFHNPIASITFKDLGTITFELYVQDAPQSVLNFVELANSKYYDGISMHRIINNFVAQGGDPTGFGSGGPGYSIYGEFLSNNFENTVGHEYGALAFARTQVPNSAGSQFYIVLSDYADDQRQFMDENYAAFGHILEGHDLLVIINEEYAAKDNSGIPLKELIIESITIDTHEQQLPSPTKFSK